MSLTHQGEELSLTLFEALESKPLMNAAAEEEVSFIVDSAAAETVIPQDTAQHVAGVKGTKYGTM